MYVLSWQTVSALTRVLFLCLLPLFLHDSGNKPQDNPLMSAGTVCCIYSREILVISISNPAPDQSKLIYILINGWFAEHYLHISMTQH